MWVLIYIFALTASPAADQGGGATTNSVEFRTEANCLLAAGKINEDDALPGIVTRAWCFQK